MTPFIAALKLFAKPVAKSNRNLITNALQFSVFPGAVSADARNKVRYPFMFGNLPRERVKWRGGYPYCALSRVHLCKQLVVSVLHWSLIRTFFEQWSRLLILPYLSPVRETIEHWETRESDHSIHSLRCSVSWPNRVRNTSFFSSVITNASTGDSTSGIRWEMIFDLSKVVHMSGWRGSFVDFHTVKQLFKWEQEIRVVVFVLSSTKWIMQLIEVVHMRMEDRESLMTRRWNLFEYHHI